MSFNWKIGVLVVPLAVVVGIYAGTNLLTGDEPVVTQTSGVISTPDSVLTAHVGHNHTNDQVAGDPASADEMEAGLIIWDRLGCDKVYRNGSDGKSEVSIEECDFRKLTVYSDLSEEELLVAIQNYDGEAAMELAIRLWSNDLEKATDLFLKSAAYIDSTEPLGRYISLNSQSEVEGLKRAYVMARVMEYGGSDVSYADSMERRLKQKHDLTRTQVEALNGKAKRRLDKLGRIRAKSVGGNITLRNSMEGEKS